MIRTTGTILLLGALLIGCADRPTMTSNVFWQEGEAYVDGPRNEAEGIARKLPASNSESLYGAVLGAKGGFVRYQIKLAKDIANARIIVRYSRYHWKPMDPATVSIELLSKKKTINAEVVFDNTGGWGTKNKADWGIAVVEAGEMPAGDWIVKFMAPEDKAADVNIDGFFIVADSTEITADEMALADRIHINSDRFVGVGLPSHLVNQHELDRFNLPVRMFKAKKLGVKVTLLDEQDRQAVKLIDVDSVPLDMDTRTVLVSSAKFATLPDGAYILRTEWQGADAMDLPVNMMGDLAAGFEGRLAAIGQFAQAMGENPTKLQARHVPGFEHALEYLAAGWKDILAGTADKNTLAGVRRTLTQYERTAAMLSGDMAPYARRAGDLRLAFRSEATGRLEQYRLFIPNSYSPDGKTPLIVTLNHNENKFLDQANGITKTLANERGYAILSPGPVGTDGPTANYEGDGLKDLVQLLELVLGDYSGIDRSRVYCTGTSLGGFGTYNFATERPEYFAAIACSSGTGNWIRKPRKEWKLIEKYTTVPTLILHGEIDNLVPAEGAQQVAEKLASRNIDHEIHVFPSHGHSYENYAEQYFTMTLDFFDRYPAADNPAETVIVEPNAGESPEQAEAEPQDEAEAKGEPETPDAEQAPTETETPEVEQAPAEVETPEVEQAPVEAETPEAEQSPAEQETPKVEQAPAETETPEAKQAPAAAETPEAEQAPAEQETPEGEQAPAEVGDETKPDLPAPATPQTEPKAETAPPLPPATMPAD